MHIYVRLSLFGGLDTGLDCGTGLRDWTHRRLCSSDFKAAHTPLHTWTEFRADNHHSISMSVHVHIFV